MTKYFVDVRIVAGEALKNVTRGGIVELLTSKRHVAGPVSVKLLGEPQPLSPEQEEEIAAQAALDKQAEEATKTEIRKELLELSSELRTLFETLLPGDAGKKEEETCPHCGTSDCGNAQATRLEHCSGVTVGDDLTDAVRQTCAANRMQLSEEDVAEAAETLRKEGAAVIIAAKWHTDGLKASVQVALVATADDVARYAGLRKSAEELTQVLSSRLSEDPQQDELEGTSELGKISKKLRASLVAQRTEAAKDLGEKAADQLLALLTGSLPSLRKSK